MKSRVRRACNAIFASALVLSLVAGSTAAAEPEQAKAGAVIASAAQAGPIIPRDVLFGNPERAAVRVSPDGQTLSWLAPHDGVLNLWVAPVSDPKNARPITADKGRGLRTYNWAYTSKDILFTQDEGGDENWKVMRVNIDSGDIKNLTPFESIKGPDGQPLKTPGGKILRPSARIEAVSDAFPGEVLIGLNNRDAQYHDVYKVDIASGNMTPVFMNTDGFAGVEFDSRYSPRFAVKTTPEGGVQTFRRQGETKDGQPTWAPFLDVGFEDAQTTSLGGMNKKGDVVYITESRGRNTAALGTIDEVTGKVTIIAEDAKADAAGALADPKTDTVQAVSFNYLRPEWKVIDQSIAGDLAYLQTVCDGEITVASRSSDDSVWTIAYLEDDAPVQYYLYQRHTDASKAGAHKSKATFLFTNRTALEGQPLTPMHPVVIKSRDGLDMVCYLSLPKGSFEVKGDAVKAKSPMPLVLNVHGGPWARDRWGLHPEHQWLANRGYAVLSVNYRGSTGFGKNFMNAANLEWGGKMHDDLIDAVNWAIKEGIADTGKVAIYGGSYGGYAALVGATFTPDVFACAVDIVGVSNLQTFMKSIPPYWKPMLSMLSKRVGDMSTEEGMKFLASRSPVNFVDRITKPLLIAQGANDPRVVQAESDQIVHAMQKKGIPVTYVLYPDEGHGFARPENRMSFYAVAEAFLAQHLGGRFEPIGSAFKGSSVTVPEGAEHVPGLSGAIGAAGK